MSEDATSAKESQQTLGGGVIEEPDEDEPKEDDRPQIELCDVCGKQAVVDGVLGMEYGGQVLCHRGCSRETVAFVVHCECCGWFNEIQGTEFERYAARQRAQQERNGHEARGRKLELIHHEVNYREVATA